MRLLTKFVVALIFASSLPAQEFPSKKTLLVTMLPAPAATVARGKANLVNLRFRVEPGFHINSHKPAAEYMIPTTLQLDAPTDIAVGRITYPPGQEMSFTFAPGEKLSVYSGDFTLAVSVRPLASVLPSTYEFRGKLRYQACDNAACYPPKNLPVGFAVRVAKAPRPARKNPAQSPHAHN